MKDYEIVIDCTCDLNEEVRKQFGIYNDYFHGIIYIPGREDKLSDLSYSDIKSDEYYALIKKHAGKVRTAFATFAKAKGKDKAKEILAQFNAHKVTELKEDDYNAVMKVLEG